MISVRLHDYELGEYNPGENHRFSYTDEGLARSIPYSLSIPPRQRTHQGTLVKTTVDNLVPDDPRDRRTLAEQAGLASSGSGDLIEHFGQETIGALRFVPSGSSPDPTNEQYRLDESDRAAILDSLEETPTGSFQGQPLKLSLTGTQSKVGLRYDSEEDDWYLPTGSAPSTHLLKPPRDSAYFDNHLTEYLSMRMADGLGLWVPDVDVLEANGREAFVIERFDRVRREGSIHRIHQEDFARAMGRSPSLRYPKGALQPELADDQVEDGINKAFSLLDDYSDDVQADQRQFARGQIASWLLGNTDGHFKNYGLYLENEGEPIVRMTPFYDIASTEPYNRSNPAVDESNLMVKTNQGVTKPLDHPMRMAMPVGPGMNFELEAIHPGDFIDLVHKPSCRLDRSTLRDECQQMLDRVPEALENLHDRVDLADDDRLDRLRDPIQAAVESRSQDLRSHLEESGDPTTQPSGLEHSPR